MFYILSKAFYYNRNLQIKLQCIKETGKDSSIMNRGPKKILRCPEALKDFRTKSSIIVTKNLINQFPTPIFYECIRITQQ